MTREHAWWRKRPLWLFLSCAKRTKKGVVEARMIMTATSRDCFKQPTTQEQQEQEQIQQQDDRERARAPLSSSLHAYGSETANDNMGGTRIIKATQAQDSGETSSFHVSSKPLSTAVHYEVCREGPVYQADSIAKDTAKAEASKTSTKTNRKTVMTTAILAEIPVELQPKERPKRKEENNTHDTAHDSIVIKAEETGKHLRESNPEEEDDDEDDEDDDQLQQSWSSLGRRPPTPPPSRRRTSMTSLEEEYCSSTDDEDDDDDDDDGSTDGTSGDVSDDDEFYSGDGLPSHPSNGIPKPSIPKRTASLPQNSATSWVKLKPEYTSNVPKKRISMDLSYRSNRLSLDHTRTFATTASSAYAAGARKRLSIGHVNSPPSREYVAMLKDSPASRREERPYQRRASLSPARRRASLTHCQNIRHHSSMSSSSGLSTSSSSHHRRLSMSHHHHHGMPPSPRAALAQPSPRRTSVAHSPAAAAVSSSPSNCRPSLSRMSSNSSLSPSKISRSGRPLLSRKSSSSSLSPGKLGNRRPSFSRMNSNSSLSRGNRRALLTRQRSASPRRTPVTNNNSNHKSNNSNAGAINSMATTMVSSLPPPKLQEQFHHQQEQQEQNNNNSIVFASSRRGSMFLVSSPSDAVGFRHSLPPCLKSSSFLLPRQEQQPPRPKSVTFAPSPTFFGDNHHDSSSAITDQSLELDVCLEDAALDTSFSDPMAWMGGSGGGIQHQQQSSASDWGGDWNVGSMDSFSSISSI